LGGWLTPPSQHSSAVQNWGKAAFNPSIGGRLMVSSLGVSDRDLLWVLFQPV